tara:strand:- start:4625 stop:4822 length:198 start_codon:yes stop_codon:yes gene_type:complete
MKAIDFLNKLGLVLFSLFALCVVMLGIAYNELRELEEKMHKNKGSQERAIEARLEEMMRKMEKDD